MEPIAGGTSYGYGLWWLVILNSAIFVIFALSFYKPKTSRDWKSFGIFSSFVVALFAEMYGFPLTIFLLSGWLSKKFPGIDLYSHENGHLLELFFQTNSNPHFGILHIISNILIIVGFMIIARGWRELYTAQKKKAVAVSGPYQYVRHPQYAGFVLVMFGFLFQWPTIVTLAMFPILVTAYYFLSLSEEKESVRFFGKEYEEYARKVPRFVPHIFNR